MVSPTTDRRLGLAGNTAYKVPATVVSMANIVQSGEQTIDGVAVKASNAAGLPDRVLCTGMTDATKNGLWDVQTSAWTRCIDANGNYDLTQGSQVAISQGSNAGQVWMLTTLAPITIGTTALVFAQSVTSSFLSTLLTAAGSTLVGWIQAGTGAVLRTVSDKLRERISIFDFMTAAQIADWRARTLTLDMTPAAQAALTYANSIGGAVVLVPTGSGKFNSSLNIFKYTQLVGEGRTASVLSFTNAGDGIKSTWPINSSTAVWLGARDLAIVNTNGANTGGGFVDVGGTFVDLFNVYISGFRYEVIFDQTEIATIDKCEILHGSGQTGIWLVNGADHTALANTGFTNRITISRNQFNGAGSSLENIQDDGGVNHTICDNNFNAGGLALRASGVSGLAFRGNESESHTGSAVIVLTNTTKAAAYVSGCGGVEISGGNTFFDFTGVHIQIVEVQGGVITGNVFSAATSSIFVLSTVAANPSSALVIEGNNKVVSGAGRTACIWLDSGSLVPYRNVQFRQTPQTYVSSALASTGSQTITPQTMEMIHCGSRLICQNQDGTSVETVIVTATTGTTFTATFASTKNQSNWCIYGATPSNEEEGVWTPTLQGTSTAGSHTAAGSTGKWSRRGDMVRLTGQIVITAKDASMAGNLQIGGVPFATDAVGNQVGTGAVTGFSGFTLPAGFSQLGIVLLAGGTANLYRSGSAVALTQCIAGDVPGTTCQLVFAIDMETSSN